MRSPADLNSLSVNDLVVRSRHRELVRGITFAVGAGERVALIGESGSGKTLTAAAIMGLLPENLHASGEIEIGSIRNLLDYSDQQLSELRGSVISMVFQEPMTALDPLMRVGNQVAEAFAIHTNSRINANTKAQAEQALAEVGLPPTAYRAYPHQLSGGQRQRVLIAMALANKPTYLIADEPTTALDVTVQAQVLELLCELVKARGAGLLFITHDLGVVARIATSVYVMQNGVIVESGSTGEILKHPKHQYTQALISASDLKQLELTSNNSITNLTENIEKPIIELKKVTKEFSRSGGLFGSRAIIPALNGISFQVFPGERFGIVGESGSGKTTALRIIAGLETATRGSVTVLGQQLPNHAKNQNRADKTAAEIRSQVQLVFQDPNSSLDPRVKIGDTIAEPLLNPIVQQRLPHAATKAGRAQLVAEMLQAVGLPPAAANDFPHEFSGGQRQRISIARALISQPKILIADEPISALDVSVRAQILQLLADQVTQRNLTLILVSHDLAVIQHLCDRVAVMHNGQIVEQGVTADVWANPSHAYTRQLQAAAL